MLACVPDDLGKGKKNKLSLHESVREGEKGERRGGENATPVQSCHE